MGFPPLAPPRALWEDALQSALKARREVMM